MNPRTRFFRGIAVAALLGVGLAACEETNVIVPTTPTISAAPANITLNPGQTQTIVATLTGIEGGITYTSENNAVATVSAAGVVTAVAPGSATIRVAATADASVATAVNVTVNAPEVPPTEESSVSIQSITVGNTTVPVNPAAVTGLISLSLNVERGEADQLRVFVGNIEVEGCRQTFASSDAPVAITAEDLSVAAQGTTVICSINTAAFNISNGQGIPVFANNTYAFRAELTENGTVLDSATSADYTFTNVDFTVVNLSTPNSVVSQTSGLLWNGGAVSVTAIPVIFTGAPVASVVFSYGGNTRTDTTPADGFTATYATTGANNIGGVTDAAFVITTSSVRQNGQPGPTGNSNTSLPAGVTAFRLDNGAPVGGTFVLVDQDIPTALCCSANWVGTAYAFAAGKAGQSDAGVGLPTTGAVTFHVGANGLTNTQLAALAPVTTGADLAETATNTDLDAVAVVKDQLGNQTIVALTANGANTLTTLGIDKTNPTASFANTSVGQMAVFNIAGGAPAANFVVAYSDAASGGAGPSGFAATPVATKLDRWFPGLTAAQRCLLAGTTACPYVDTNGTTAVPVDNGYFTYSATVVDQAGNLSHPLTAPLSRIVLNDQTLPTAGSIVIPSTLTGGAATTFSVDAIDDLNLLEASLRLDFGGVESLPFAAPVAINGQFPTALVTNQTVAQTIPFVRALEQAAPAPAGALQATTDVTYLISDAAVNEFTRTNPIQVAVPAGVSFNTRGVLTFQITAPAAAQNVCSAATGCLPAGTPSSRTVTITATGASGTFANPFQTVHLYRRDAGGIVRYIGAAGAPSVTDDGVTRTWTWTASFSALGLPIQANVPIFAVGVASVGDALQAADNTNISIVAPV